MTIETRDRLEIEDLAARYNLAIDLGDPAGWVASFLSDGEFEIAEVGPRTGTRRQLAVGRWRGMAELTLFAQTVAGVLPCRHWSYNRVLTPAGDGLDSVSYMNVYYLDFPPGDQLITGIMRDHLVRVDVGWRFARRKITFD